MSKQQHTLGPWKYFGAFNGSDFTVTKKNDEHTKIAVISFEHSGMEEAKSPTEATANARLIAAAPELLEALKDLTEYVDQYARSVDSFGYTEAAAKAHQKSHGTVIF